MCYIKDISISKSWTKPWDKSRGRSCPYGNSQWVKNYVPVETVDGFSKAKIFLHANGGNYHKLSRDVKNFKQWDL